MIPETLALWIAVGGNAILAAKLLAFRLKDPVFARLPDGKSTEAPDKSTAYGAQLPADAIQLPMYSSRLPHYRKPQLACVSLPKATDLLIDWCNGQGLVGVYCASEIATYWKTACIELDLEPLNVKLIWEAFDGRGLRLGLKRLNTPEYIAIRQRTGKDRLVLFRIPRCRVVAGSMTEAPATTPDLPATSRQQPGTVPAMTQKSSQIRRAA